jgi:hypothetical protein
MIKQAQQFDSCCFVDFVIEDPGNLFRYANSPQISQLKQPFGAIG